MVRISEDWLCKARKATRVALIAHVSPDGDTLGATLALRLAFLSLGKAVDVICDGDGENEALAEAAAMIESGFGE